MPTYDSSPVLNSSVVPDNNIYPIGDPGSTGYFEAVTKQRTKEVITGAGVAFAALLIYIAITSKPKKQRPKTKGRYGIWQV